MIPFLNDLKKAKSNIREQGDGMLIAQEEIKGLDGDVEAAVYFYMNVSMATKENWKLRYGRFHLKNISSLDGKEYEITVSDTSTDEEFSFCIDCATSIVQRGKIEYWARNGQETPASCVVARDGSTMTDSEAILEALVAGQAALAPLGGGPGDETAGYKGYGYAAVVEILSAALSGGQFMKALTGVAEDGSPRMYGLGHFFFVIDPEAFVGDNEFRRTAGEICRALRASEKAPGHNRIFTAGEKEYLVWLERKEKGVPVSSSVQAELLAVRDELNLDFHFPFE